MECAIQPSTAQELLEGYSSPDSSNETKTISMSGKINQTRKRKRRSAAIAIGSMTEMPLRIRMRRSECNQVIWGKGSVPKCSRRPRKINRKRKRSEDINSSLQPRSKNSRTKLKSNSPRLQSSKKTATNFESIANDAEQSANDMCEVCQVFFTIIRTMARHTGKAHGRRGVMPENAEGKNGTRTTNKYEIGVGNKHEETDGNTINCEICEHSADTFIKLAKHQRSAHRESQWEMLDHRKYGYRGKSRRIILTKFLYHLNVTKNRQKFDSFKLRALNKITMYKSRKNKHPENQAPEKEKTNTSSQVNGETANDRTNKLLSGTTKHKMEDGFAPLLNHLLVSIQEKDKYHTFYEPVTEDIAPDYFNIIKDPMDLKTMEAKVKNHQYNTLEDFSSDFVLICKNAMLYNAYQSPIYAKAARFKRIGLDLMSENSIRYFIDVLGITDLEKAIPETNEATNNLHERLTQLLVLFEEKDKDLLLFESITNEAAPGHLDVICNLMDLDTMKKKLDSNQYKSVEEFNKDFELTCTNAMSKYPANSVLHQKAIKFQRYGTMLVSQSSIGCLKEKTPFIPKILKDQSKIDTSLSLKVNACVKSNDASAENPTRHGVDMPEEESESKVVDSPAKELKNKNPFSKLLYHLLSSLQKKDADNFFAKPVTEKIAPRYFEMVKRPMDFAAIKNKIRDGIYDTLEEFVSDFQQICKNAQLYNKSHSIYFRKAGELKTYGNATLSKHNIRSMKENLAYISEIPKEKLGFSLTPQKDSETPSKSERTVTSESSNKMASGKKVNAAKVPKETEDTEEMSEYEKLRARNIAMRKQMMATVLQDVMDVSSSMGFKPREKFPCTQCDHVAHSLSNLDGHINYVHENKAPFKCEHCEYETAFEMNLNRHIKFEHEKFMKLFKCDTCDMTTPSKRALGLHIDFCDGSNSGSTSRYSIGDNLANIEAPKLYDEILKADLPLTDEEPLQATKDISKMGEKETASVNEESTDSSGVIKSLLNGFIHMFKTNSL